MTSRNGANRAALFIPVAFLDVILLVLLVTLMNASFRKKHTVRLPNVSQTVEDNATSASTDASESVTILRDGTIQYGSMTVSPSGELSDVLARLIDAKSIELFVETDESGVGNTTTLLRLVQEMGQVDGLSDRIRIVVDEREESVGIVEPKESV